ncbi:uncharacterized protein B0H18DRAFT_14073 [Fomitopsis serialis]|uniref:uncharacterized protein n=1 Tax=Fomitopsis serialis TaxID=139415 RepID=UPI00200749D6|nr:uncharacterized protein B0H18DRAFT_14073 [Neoantrodia serialis]KAH9938405.1 hypothetical protein B0H18DRAFT_14073 [Neoantrodia serialis]
MAQRPCGLRADYIQTAGASVCLLTLRWRSLSREDLSGSEPAPRLSSASVISGAPIHSPKRPVYPPRPSPPTRPSSCAARPLRARTQRNHRGPASVRVYLHSSAASSISFAPMLSGISQITSAQTGLMALCVALSRHQGRQLFSCKIGSRRLDSDVEIHRICKSTPYFFLSVCGRKCICRMAFPNNHTIRTAYSHLHDLIRSTSEPP